MRPNGFFARQFENQHKITAIRFKRLNLTTQKHSNRSIKNGLTVLIVGDEFLDFQPLKPKLIWGLGRLVLFLCFFSINPLTFPQESPIYSQFINILGVKIKKTQLLDVKAASHLRSFPDGGAIIGQHCVRKLTTKPTIKWGKWYWDYPWLCFLISFCLEDFQVVLFKQCYQ